MKIKLLLMGPFPPPYHGTSIYFQKLSRMLRQDPELDVKIIDTSDHRADLNNLGRLDFLNIYFALKSIFKLIVILLIKRVDIVYIPISQNTLAYIRDGIFIILSKLFRCKVIIHLHGSYFLDFYNKSLPLYKKFIDISIKKVDGAIVLGEKLKYIFEKWLPYNRIFVLPNFVDWFPKVEQKIEKQRMNSNALIISYLGNLTTSKGIFDLLEAISLIKNKTKTRFILRIAGEFKGDSIGNVSAKTIKNSFFSYLKQLGTDTLDYVGPIKNEDQKIEFLLNTDIFVFPSWYEGQPLVIIEAMSCGCPVISTKGVGVIDETVIDGFNGVLVEKKNPKELAEAIIKLMNDDKLRQEMGLNSLTRFKKEFTSEKHLQNFKKILYAVYYNCNFAEIQNLESIKVIEPRHLSKIRELRNYSFKKVIKFFFTEGPLLTFRKVRSKMIYEKVEKSTKLLILKFNINNDKIFLFTRLIGYNLKYDEDLAFKLSADKGFDFINLNDKILNLFESYLPVYSCPKELKQKLREAILEANPFLMPLSEGLGISSISLPQTHRNIELCFNRSENSNLSVFILGFGSYIYEYVLKHFKNSIVAGLDYKSDIITNYARFRFPIFNNFDEVLKVISSVNEPLVIIATYHSDHAWMAKEVLTLNPTAKVFIEKPACVTLQDADLLIALRNKGYWIDIGYNRRYAYLTRVVKSYVDRVNEPILLTCLVKELKIPETHWYLWPNQGTRIFGNLVHWIDLVRFFLGKKQLRKVYTAGKGDESISIILTFEDGSIVTIVSTDKGDDLGGVEEYIELRYSKTTLKLYDYKKLKIYMDGNHKSLNFFYRDKGHHNMYKTLKQQVQKKLPPMYPAEDIYWVTNIADEILKMLNKL